MNPSYRGRAITLTFDQFKYGWANALDEDEAKHLYDTYHVAGSGIALAQMADSNLNPWTESKVDTKNPDRGPLLILDGEKDHTVPWAIANASYKRQKRNPSVTEIKKMPNRGHSLTIDHGWQDVAQTALDFVKRFVPAKPVTSAGERSRSRPLPLPDCVGQVGHPLRRLRADRLQGHAARVHALEQADSGAEQHG